MKQEQITQFIDGLELDPKRKLVVRQLITSLIDTIINGASEIELATSDKIGGIKTGYSANGKNYPLLIDENGKAYVAVNWTDTNTTYNVVGANGTTGLIKNGSAITSADGYTPCPIINGVPYYKESAAPASAEPAVAVLEREK